MKKLLFLAFTAAVCVGMTSCLKENGNGESSTSYNGKLLYYYSTTQQNYAMDPVDIAFRFGVLLRESTDTGLAFDQVTYGTESKKLVDRLFAGTDVTFTKNGDVYAITFPVQANMVRSGTWYIDTKGKMLDELDDQRWDIYLGTGSDATFKYYDTSSAAHPVSVLVNSTLISISNNVNGGWSIMNRGYIANYASSKIESLWSGSFDVMQANGRSLKYTNAKLTPFSLNGSASGDTMFGSGTMIYNIETPFVFTPTCSAGFISDGAVTVGFDSSVEVNTNYYPERTGKMEIVSNSCKATYYYTYAGEKTVYATVTSN